MMREDRGGIEAMGERADGMGGVKSINKKDLSNIPSRP